MSGDTYAVPCPHCGAFYIEVALVGHIAWKHPGKKAPEHISAVLDRALREVKRRAGR